MENFAEFAERLGLTLASAEAPGNPNLGDWGEGAKHWFCTLHREGATPLSFFYTMGSGHKYVTAAAARMMSIGSKWRAGWKPGEEMPYLHRPTIHEKEAMDLCTFQSPKIADVLYCVINDAGCVEGANTFDEYCDLMGEDNDSRRAERCYHACQDTAYALRRMIGVEELSNAWELEE